MPASQPTVLILASGRGQRFVASGGIGSKLQAMLHGKTVLQHTVDAVRASGLRVTYVRNITDIDDKIIKRAVERGIPIRQLTAEMTAAMHEDIGRIGVLPPTHEPRATEYVPQMVSLIGALLPTQDEESDVDAGDDEFVDDAGDDEAMAETEHERGQAGRLRKLSSQHLPGMATGSFRFRPRAWWLSFRLTASPTRHVAAAVRLDLGSADHHELRRRQLPPGKRGSANGQRRPDRV